MADEVPDEVPERVPDEAVVPVPAGLARIRTRVVPALLHCVAPRADSAAFLPGELVTVVLDSPSEGTRRPATADHQQLVVSLPGHAAAIDPAAAMGAVERVGTTRLDVRIGADDDPEAVVALLAAVRRARPHWKVQVSMGAMPYGLSSSCVALLRDAWDGGRPDCVAVVVDEHFGEGFRRPPGDYAVEALASVRRQLLKLDGYGGGGRDVYADAPGVGIILDDYRDEEAAKVAAYALRHASWVPFVGVTAGSGAAILREWPRPM